MGKSNQPEEPKPDEPEKPKPEEPKPEEPEKPKPEEPKPEEPEKPEPEEPKSEEPEKPEPEEPKTEEPEKPKPEEPKPEETEKPEPEEPAEPEDSEQEEKAKCTGNEKLEDMMVDCSPSKISVKVSECAFINQKIDVSQVKISKPSEECKRELIDGMLTFSLPTNSKCGTEISLDENEIRYSNRLHAVTDDKNSVISRSRSIEIDFSCSLTLGICFEFNLN